MERGVHPGKWTVENIDASAPPRMGLSMIGLENSPLVHLIILHEQKMF